MQVYLGTLQIVLLLAVLSEISCTGITGCEFALASCYEAQQMRRALATTGWGSRGPCDMTMVNRKCI